MRFLRVVAILGIAAGLVAGWTIAQPAVESAGSKLMSAVTTTGPVTYYVRPGGDDTAAGTSPAAAWRTLARASGAILRPGTRLLLLGGKQYPGSLVISKGDAGNVRSPILVSSYGKGRATIVSGTN